MVDISSDETASLYVSEQISLTEGDDTTLSYEGAVIRLGVTRILDITVLSEEVITLDNFETSSPDVHSDETATLSTSEDDDPFTQPAGVKVIRPATVPEVIILNIAEDSEVTEV